MQVIQVIYNNHYRLEAKPHDDIFEELNEIKGESGRYRGDNNSEGSNFF